MAHDNEKVRRVGQGRCEITRGTVSCQEATMEQKYGATVAGDGEGELPDAPY